MVINFISSVANFNIEKKTISYKNTAQKYRRRLHENAIKINCKIKNQKLLQNSYLALVFYFISSNPNVVFAVPDLNPGKNVIDESGSLTKSSISYIEKSLSKVKETTQTDVYFVSVRNLPYGIDPQEYAKELFGKWNLSEKDVLVILVNKLAKAGIYYGNQVGVLNDDIARSIGNETYTFKAKNEQYSSAALDVNNRLVSILLEKGDPGAPSENRSTSVSNFKTAKKTEESRSKYIAIIAILLIIAFVVPMIQFFYYVKDE